jgi:hypothetical protein
MSGEDWSGCSKGRKVGANNSDLRVTLAEVHTKKGRSDDSSASLEGVLSETDRVRSPIEQEEIRAKARRLLEKLKWSV